MTVTIKDNKLAIVIDLKEKVSTSGKNLIIASTGGNAQTEVEYNGKKVVVGLNAWVKI